VSVAAGRRYSASPRSRRAHSRVTEQSSRESISVSATARRCQSSARASGGRVPSSTIAASLPHHSSTASAISFMLSASWSRASSTWAKVTGRLGTAHGLPAACCNSPAARCSRFAVAGTWPRGMKASGNTPAIVAARPSARHGLGPSLTIGRHTIRRIDRMVRQGRTITAAVVGTLTSGRRRPSLVESGRAARLIAPACRGRPRPVRVRRAHGGSRNASVRHGRASRASPRRSRGGARPSSC
jgi:hypothetical protein